MSSRTPTRSSGSGSSSPAAVVARSARADEVVVAARRLLEEEGAGALTMRRLAEQLGIKAPSLYKHLPDKTALEAAIIATGLEEAAARFEQAVAGATTGGDAAGEGATAISALAAFLCCFNCSVSAMAARRRWSSSRKLSRLAIFPRADRRETIVSKFARKNARSYIHSC